MMNDLDENGTIAMIRAERIMQRAERRLERMAISESDHEGAAIKIKTRGIGGLDKNKLWSEWRNTVVTMSAEQFEALDPDPAKAYYQWLDQRIANPYQMTSRAFEKARRRFNSEFLNRFAFTLWPVEIAWAQRLRRSPNDRVAVVSRLFLSQIAKDPSAEVVQFGEACVEAMSEPDYYNAPERHYEPSQIRDGYGSDLFRPAFLRLAEAVHAIRLQKIDPDDLTVMAEVARREEERDLAIIARTRAIRSARRSPLSRNVTVITVAIERGLSSDALVLAEEGFLAEVETGISEISADTRYPQSEFIDWLRSGRNEAVTHDPNVEHSDLWRYDVRHWISELPIDFGRFGARDVKSFHAWMESLGTRPSPPIDPVVDYGMYLIRKSSNPVTFVGTHGATRDLFGSGAVDG